MQIEDILVDALADHFAPDEIDDIAFYPDKETAAAYMWNFELNKKRYTLMYTYSIKRVELVCESEPCDFCETVGKDVRNHNGNLFCDDCFELCLEDIIKFDSDLADDLI